MKTIFFSILLVLSAPIMAGFAENGAFFDPDSEVREGIFVTRSASGKISFSFFTTFDDCDYVEVLEVEEYVCEEHHAWFVSGLHPVFVGESVGILHTAIDGETVTVGTYFLNETTTGYALIVVHSGESPFDPDSQIYNTTYDFNTCIVSPDPNCGAIPED
jgi:hypothetical protein